MCALNCVIFSLALLQLLVVGEINGQGGKQLTLTVLHTNDVHSRFLETNRYSGACTEEERTKKGCYGGFSRIHYKVISRN